MFARTQSETGSIELRWTPLAVPSLHAWILLVDPETIDPQTLPREAFLRELIRVPLTAASGRALVYVPVGRTLGLALIARDADDRPLEPLPFDLVRAEAPPAPRDPPVVASPSERTPLVFTTGQGARETLASLARTVALRAAVPTPKAPGPTGFGVRQRRTLTRLGFSATADRPRVVVVRETFIGEDQLAAWESAPPPDARPLPDDADGFVDALSDEDSMTFYAVLEGPTPWRPLALTLAQPPFDAILRPYPLGDVAARLAPLIAAAPADGPGRELIDAARRGLA